MEEKKYSVLFKNNNKPYSFKSTLVLSENDEVIVETEKGLQYGKIVSHKTEENTDDIKDIIRVATDEDKQIFYNNLKDAELAVEKCKNLVKELNLEMDVVNANFSFDRSQLLINFSADERIDFRELARKLAGIYHTRIELRQIGARDRAKLVGGIGICGQKLCCSSFLGQIDSISMNKAKNQNLALNPSKINGACGRLLCCLCYEDEEYTRCSKGLKSVGYKFKYEGKDAVITSVDILSRTYKVLCDDEKITVKADDLNDK